MVKDLSQELVKELKQDNPKVSKTCSAVVSRVDKDGTVWVRVAGSEKETPTASTSAEVKRGDSVTVEWRNNKLYVAGNYTDPSAGSTRVTAVEDSAARANDAAMRAVNDANIAKTAAEQAVADAETAQTAAGQAQTAASSAQTQAAAAATAASNAQTSANNASEYASRALGNLSAVQNVAETLNWITAHGTMTLTTDTALDPTHVYFVNDPDGDYTVGQSSYSVVSEPIAEDLDVYYELSIDESLNNYVATHLALDAEGLWIIPEANGSKVLIATGNGTTYTTAGTYIISHRDGADRVIAKFTSTGMAIDGRIQAGKNIQRVGYNSIAVGDAVQAEEGNTSVFGWSLTANGSCQTVIGRNNIADTAPMDGYGYRKYAFIVGNGSPSGRNDYKRNAFTVDWAGNIWSYGDIEDGSGNVLSDKADTSDLPAKTSDLVNDSGFLTAETDPTVPAWAKASTKPSYTASEVGALPDTTVIPSKTSDLTNDSGFFKRAYAYINEVTATTITAVSAAGRKKVPIESLKERIGFTYDSTNKGIIVSESGMYAISITLGVNPATSGDLMGALVYRNSSVLMEPSYKRIGGNYDEIVVSPVIAYLNAGEVLTLYCQNNTGGRGTIYSGKLAVWRVG